MWLFHICNANTGNDKEVRERKTCSYADPVQLCNFYLFIFFTSIKFPAVICIVLHQYPDETEVRLSEPWQLAPTSVKRGGRGGGEIHLDDMKHI